jgi:o-succinylbenzoate synthase
VCTSKVDPKTLSNASWIKHELQFRRPSGTSRGVLHHKPSYFLRWTSSDWKYPALGECSLIPGLSPDPSEGYEDKLSLVVDWLNGHIELCPDLSPFPSIAFGLETLLQDKACKGSKVLYPSAFTQGHGEMQINGLVWMGDPSFMRAQIQEKVERGYQCIKLKIGAIDFNEELALLAFIRKEFGLGLELRVDANGAFDAAVALERLKQLSAFDIHSIEQPIRPGQWEEMARLCEKSPIAIALDEELIGLSPMKDAQRLMERVKPSFLILKPSLLGGLKRSREWISAAESAGVSWWMTSALESNIGLNAITQYTFTQDVSLPQGLGTGGLYSNNVDSPLYLQGQMIRFNPTGDWDLEALQP